MSQFTIPSKKAHIICTMEDSWEQVLSLQLKCGAGYECEVNRKIGVIREHIECLEATLKGSLGFKGISELESSIKAATTTSVKFEEMKEIKEKFNFKAPEKGRYVCCLFQKKQIFDFKITEYRLFRDVPLHFKIDRLLMEYRDDSRRCEYDPDCDETITPPPPPDGVVDLVLKGGNLTVSAPYRISEAGVEFINMGLRADVDPTNLTFKRTRISSEMLSEPARLFARITEPHVDAMFFPASVVSGIIPSVRPGFKVVREEEGTLVGKFPTRHSPSVEARIEPFLYPNVKEIWRGLKDFPLVSMEKIIK
jgi:hypothetical protein